MGVLSEYSVVILQREETRCMENACSEKSDGDAIDANKLNSSSTKSLPRR